MNAEKIEAIAREMLSHIGGVSRLEAIARELDAADARRGLRDHGEMQEDLRRWAQELGEAV